MMTFNKEQIVNELKSGVCTVTFTKVNGETRVMRCTLKDSFIPETPVVEGNSVRKVNDAVVAAWDVDANGWRSFRVENVTELK